MGALISELVREVECSIPEYKEEIFTGEMCEYPEHTPIRNRNLLVDSTHRRLTDYTYSGGGRCRRCRTGRRRRLDVRELKAMTREAVCYYADNARVAMHVAEYTLAEANNSYEEVMILAEDFYDASKGSKMVEEAEKKVFEVEKHMLTAQMEYETTQELCDLVLPNSSADLNKALKEAEKSSKKTMEETVKATESLHKIRDVRVKILTEEVKHEHDEKKDQVKAIVSTMKNGLEKKLEDLKEEIEDAKDKAKNEKDKKKKREYEDTVDKLEEEKKKLETEYKESEKFLKADSKMDEKIEILRAELSNADGEDDWLKLFSKLLTNEIPGKLLYYYNSTSGGGCLDEKVMPKAKVECWPVDKKYETEPLDACELDFVYDIDRN